MFRGEEDDSDYIPKLYYSSPDFDPERASDEIEEGLNRYKKELTRVQKSHSRHTIPPNMSSIQQAKMKQLRNQDDNKFKILNADKNLGQSIAHTTFITERGVQEHLSNEDVYRKVPEQQAHTLQKGFELQMERFITKASSTKAKAKISKAERTFLSRGLKQEKGSISKFYLTAKVHKPDLEHRPIVANCGTPQSVLSRWIDYKLQKVKSHIGTYIKDSNDLIDKLKELDLPSNARGFKADANKMYTSIDIEHGLEVLRQFLEELEQEGNLPLDFDIDLIVEAASLVMRWNIFEYGDCHFIQKRGTAMGTPFACIWASIYYWMHEKHVLIPKYESKIPLLVRFIDDIYGILKLGDDDGMSADELEQFESDLDEFGPCFLTWDMEQPTKSVDFLDLTVTIDNGKVSTRTFRKERNLYQYLSPLSNHPRGIIKSMIHGMLKQYFRQNSNREDYWKNAMLLHRYLRKRGWQRDTIDPIFIKAHNKITQQSKTKKKPAQVQTTQEDTNLSKMVILHQEYHSHGITRNEIRNAYDKHLGELLSQDVQDGGLGIDRTIVAFHRPPNLRDLLQSSRLRQVQGSEVSTYFGG